MRRTSSIVALPLLLVCSSTRAEPGGVREHDGLYLNFELGPGVLTSKGAPFVPGPAVPTQNYRMSGGGTQVSLALGVAVNPSFVGAFRLFSAAVSSARFTMNGATPPTAGAPDFGLAGFGVDLVYYLMPWNLYFSATPALFALTTRRYGRSESTERALAFRLALGKEWWISDNWGLGLNLQYAHSRNKDSYPPSWMTDWLGVALSASYN